MKHGYYITHNDNLGIVYSKNLVFYYCDLSSKWRYFCIETLEDLYTVVGSWTFIEVL